MTQTTPSPSSLRGRTARHPLVVLSFVGAFLATGPLLAGAQVRPVIVEGSRVRVTAPALGLHRTVGRVQGAREDALVLRFGHRDGPLTILRSSITAMDVSIGRERKVAKAVGLGFGVGAGVGALIGLAQGDDPPGQFFGYSAEAKALVFGIAAGGAGAAIGLLAGLAAKTDRWMPVTAAGGDLTVVPLMASGGAGLHVGLSIPIR